MDGILVYSKSLKEHCDHLQQVFKILQDHQFLLKKSKCAFAQPSLEYLGHIISSQGVAIEPTKVAVVQQWPQPINVK
jgi:hypothetical protein